MGVGGDGGKGDSTVDLTLQPAGQLDAGVDTGGFG